MDFESAAWHRARRALERHAIWAETGNGVAQVGNGLGTSYDGYHYYGTTPYMGTLWLAALKVCRVWATGRHETELITRIDNYIEAALKRMDEDLWTGHYYRAYGAPEGPNNDNCHAGMLAGEVFSRMLAGCDVLPTDRLASCRQTLLSLNLSDRFVIPPDEVHPKGERTVEYGWLPYVESFGLASLAAGGETGFMGCWERIIRAMDGAGKHPCDTRLMYQPDSGLPSWGAYYMTAPASWLVYDSLLDFFYAPGSKTLRLCPNIDGTFALIHPCFWGLGKTEKSGEGERISLNVRRTFGDGPLQVTRLEVPKGSGDILLGKDTYKRAAHTECYDLVEINPIEIKRGASINWCLT